MADIVPSLRDTSAADEDKPRVVGVDSDVGEEMLVALSSATARETLAALHERPATPSEIATRVDTSLQNVHYHVEKLADADLIEVVDTTYSEKGREMSVYAPANRPLVVFSGSDEQEAGLRAALSRLFGGVAILAVLSLAVQRLFGAGGDAGDLVAAYGLPGLAVPPGAFFFGGGAVVLLALLGWWYYRFGRADSSR